MGKLSLVTVVAGATFAALVQCSGESESLDHTRPKDGGVDVVDSSPDVAPDSLPDVVEEPPGPSAGLCGAVSWAKNYGGGPKGDLFGIEGAAGIAIDTSGNSFVTGFYYGDADFGGGPLILGGTDRSMFILKLDPSGKHLMSRGFGDPSGGVLYAPAAYGAAILALPNGGAVAAGSFAGTIDFGAGPLTSSDTWNALDAGAGCFECAPDIVVVALDAQAQTSWAKRWGDQGGDAATSLAMDSSGNIFVAGDFETSLDMGLGTPLASAGQKDGFVAKLDPNGTPLWAVRFGGPKDDAAFALALDANGDLVVGGDFTGSADFGGNQLSTSGDYDGFLLTLGADGTFKKARALGASYRGGVAGLAALPSGGFAATGWAWGTISLAGKSTDTAYSDAFVLSIAADGSEQWAKVFGTNDNDQGAAVTILPKDHVLMSASVGYGNLDLGGGLLAGNLNDGTVTLELDANGAHVCSRRFIASDSGEQLDDSGTVTLGGSIDPYAIAATANGEIVLGGRITGKSQLGSIQLASSGGSDAYVARFAAP